MTRDAHALVPVKKPEYAKTRLAPVLNRSECAQLCMAMLRDVLDSLQAAENVTAVTLVTADERVADLARECGHGVFHDTEATLCAALDKAAAAAAANGAETVLILPADLPSVTATDIDALLSLHEDGLSLCPAIRDGGTNALVCSPPTAIPFCFGRNSADRHVTAAVSSGIAHRRRCVPAFFRDIDLPDDLAWLVTQPHGRNTLGFLQRSGIGARLTPTTLGQAS